MARELYGSLLTRVASEHFYFWLNSLKAFSHAEHCLAGLQAGDYSAALSGIAEALQSYHKGIASLTVSLALCRPVFTRCGTLLASLAEEGEDFPTANYLSFPLLPSLCLPPIHSVFSIHAYGLW